MSNQQFRLYIDETGTDAIPVSDHPNHRYLAVTGVVLSRSDIDRAAARLTALKEDVFGSRHPDDRPTIIHWSSIPLRRGPFSILKDPQRADLFERRWLAFLQEIEFTCFTVSVDKAEMSRRHHWTTRHPYHYAMEILVERFVHLLERHGATGDLMPEERKGSKDRELQGAFDEIRDRGTRFVGAGRIVERLPSPTLRFRQKFDDIAGLQIADCVSSIGARISRPSSKAFEGFDVRVRDLLLAQKYCRHPTTGRIEGTGVQLIP